MILHDGEWNNFAGLVGSPQSNFEQVCRIAISRTYGGYGRFKALLNQPGVEFHLELRQSCELGDQGRWWGWQCRFYEIGSGVAIGATRKKKIAEAIAKTKLAVPALTDWVLWTRHALTKADQTWFYELDDTLELHLWTGDNLGGLLVGELLPLRRAYFGGLIITPEVLQKQFDKSTARIRGRWIPEVHHVDEVEKLLERHLGTPSNWPDLDTILDRVSSSETSIKELLPSIHAQGSQMTSDVDALLAGVSHTRQLLVLAASALRTGDVEFFFRDFPLPSVTWQQARRAHNQARKANIPVALYLANASSDIREAFSILNELKRVFSMSLVAVLADAGYGKTHLAASLASAKDSRTHGVLLHGKSLGASDSWSAVTQDFSISGQAELNLESLISGLDAIGRRLGRRLPIVIDGLNEAEDPRRWKDLLASSWVHLRDHPYVLLVCTLRPSFAGEALPEGTPRVKLQGFAEHTSDAIVKYFAHYRISPREVEPPKWLLRHPLALRFYCEVANPRRQVDVGLEGLPVSLTGLFERFLDQTAERIAELSPSSRRLHSSEIIEAIDEFGLALWESKSAVVDMKVFRTRIGDTGRWANSMVKALEEEGLLIKEPPTQARRGNGLSATFDALAGHIVACALVQGKTRGEIGELIQASETQEALFGDRAKRVRLAQDILAAFSGLFPRRCAGLHLWQLVDGAKRAWALTMASELEVEYLDSDTVQELKSQVSADKSSWYIFDRVRIFRSADGHPLNSRFLDQCLTELSLVGRDLSWSEWVRRNATQVRGDIDRWYRYWRDNGDRTSEDKLVAIWLKWCLTSTNRTLRDEATRALYFYGLGDPSGALAIISDGLGLNDLYVPERLMAVAYGLTLAQMHDRTKLVECFVPFARLAYTVYFAEGVKTSGTSHLLLYEYARRLIEVAARESPDDFPISADLVPPFGFTDTFGRIAVDQFPGGKPKYIYYSDFHNYTMSWLDPELSSYQFDDPKSKALFEKLLWRLDQFGYQWPAFGAVDEEIQSRSYDLRDDKERVERYGKKYCWIAYYELAGLQLDQSIIEPDTWEGRMSMVDIDPTFPEVPVQRMFADLELEAPLNASNWFGKWPLSRKEGGERKWLMIRGASTKTSETGRDFCRVECQALLTKSHNLKRLKKLAGAVTENPWLRDPERHYLFAGESTNANVVPRSGVEKMRFRVGETSEDVEDVELVFLDKEGREFPTDELYSEILGVIGSNPDLDMNVVAEEVISRRSLIPKKVVQTKRRENNTYETFEVFNPAWVHGWESYHSVVNPSCWVYFPSIELVEAERLSSRPQSYDLFGPDGSRATQYFEYSNRDQRRRDLNHKETMFFYCHDLVNRYLAANDLVMFWVTIARRRNAEVDEEEVKIKIWQAGNGSRSAVGRGKDSKSKAAPKRKASAKVQTGSSKASSKGKTAARGKTKKVLASEHKSKG